MLTPNAAKLIPLNMGAAMRKDNQDILDKHLSIAHLSGTRFLLLREILYLQAKGSYTIIILSTGEKIIASKPLSKFEEKIVCNWFFRVHKSYILNILHLREYCSRNGDAAIMKNGDCVSISRHRLADFLNAVEHVTASIKI